jgi:hypothetical protein
MPVMKKRLSNLQTIVSFAIMVMAVHGRAANYYVSNAGFDTAAGSQLRPFKTIQKAAGVMQPGDTCFVRSGTYREWVKPPRGGSDESKRIVYQSYPGDTVSIKGSEQITGWVKSGTIWKAELQNSLFGVYNPYKKTGSGPSLTLGLLYHLGNVYLNGESYGEKLSLAEVNAAPKTWYTTAGTATTTLIYANFGAADPNKDLAEVNARECVFYPDVKGLKYITVDGFTLTQSSENWSGMTGAEKGLLGMYAGKSWIVQNCVISDARCTGINCGNDAVPQSDINTGFDISAIGHHIIRNNHILRCGENGIMGYKGWAASVIENNLIEEINYKKTEFGGYETAGIKIHLGIDLIIRNNIIRKVYKGASGDYDGIWLDWGWQGCRISGNVLYDMEAVSVNLMFSHGPTLVDNNIFQGRSFESTSENVVFAHNIFDSCTMITRNFNAGPPPYWQPHTATLIKVSDLSFQNNRYYNNIFTVNGMSKVANAPGYKSNWNVLYRGAQKSSWGDSTSIVDNANAGVRLTSLQNGVDIIFTATNSLATAQCPLVTRDLIAVFPVLNQGMDNPDGSPCNVDKDILGIQRSSTHPLAGPFEKAASGANTFRMIVGPKSSIPVSVSNFAAPHPVSEHLAGTISVVRPDCCLITVTASQHYVVEIIKCNGVTSRVFNGSAKTTIRVPRKSIAPGLYLVRLSTLRGVTIERMLVY